MEQNKRPTIAVMGIGWVGGALLRCLQDSGYTVYPYDPPKQIGTAADLEKADVIFVCVPTPFDNTEGGFDLSHVNAAIRAIPGEKTIVIKSTVWPGTTEDIQRAFPQHGLIFNPEFLREATADKDMREPDRQIIGCTEQSMAVADKVLAILPDAPFTRTISATDAELVKYFGNCFLALKVVYANQLFDVCARAGADYETVRECAAQDPRIGQSHLHVSHNGYRGYGGHCFPKDVRAFIQYAERHGVDLDLLKVAERINTKLVESTQKCTAE